MAPALARNKPVAPDGGYGWIIVGTCAFISFTIDGMFSVFGTLLPVFVEVFSSGRGRTSVVGSVLTATLLISGPFVSVLVNWIGSRVVCMTGGVLLTAGILLSQLSHRIELLTLTFGFISGLGLGMIYLPSVVMVGYYFDKKRPLANGFSTAGSGIGMLVMAPSTAFLLRHFSWKGTLFFVSCVTLQSVICGALLRPLPENRKEETGIMLDNLTDENDEETKHTEDSSSNCKEMFDFSMLKNPTFLLVVLASSCLQTGCMIPSMFMVDYGLSLGLEKELSASLVSIFGVCNTIGRLVAGGVATIPKINAVVITAISIILAGVSTLLTVLFCNDVYIGVAFGAGLIGFFMAAPVPLTPVFLVKYLGIENLTNAFGLLNLFKGVICLLGVPFAGWLKDTTGHFLWPFTVAAILLVISGSLHLLFPVSERYRQRSASDSNGNHGKSSSPQI